MKEIFKTVSLIDKIYEYFSGTNINKPRVSFAKADFFSLNANLAF